MGKADREHLITENPLDPRNRRISVILLRESVKQAFERGAFGELPDDVEQEIEDSSEWDLPAISDEPDGSFQKTPGSVYFP